MRVRAASVPRAGVALVGLVALALVGAWVGAWLRPSDPARSTADPERPAAPIGPGGIAAPGARYAEDVRYVLAPEQIPAIDDPPFAGAGATVLPDAEPVLSVELGGHVRAYPIRYLLFHEIVNDRVGGVPIAVTYCPLCNTGVVFERPTIGGEVLSFGVSGLLLHSNLVMVDRQTGSLWSQVLGEAIGGELEGTRLGIVPAPLVSWGNWAAAHPRGLVLQAPSFAPLGPKTGSRPPYGINPYQGYDRGEPPPFFRGSIDRRLPGLARVLGLRAGGEALAVPFAVLERRAVGGWSVLGAHVGADPVVVFWHAGTVSAVDAPLLADSRDVGAAAAFVPLVEGERLRFVATREGIVDRGTGSAWDLLGRAISGPLEGVQLQRVAAVDSFWFDWAAFYPETRLAPGRTSRPSEISAESATRR